METKPPVAASVVPVSASPAKTAKRSKQNGTTTPTKNTAANGHLPLNSALPPNANSFTQPLSSTTSEKAGFMLNTINSNNLAGQPMPPSNHQNGKTPLKSSEDTDAKLKYVVEKIKSKLGKNLSMLPPPPSPIILLPTPPIPISNASYNSSSSSGGGGGGGNTPVKSFSGDGSHSFSHYQAQSQLQQQQKEREDNFLFDTLDTTPGQSFSTSTSSNGNASTHESRQKKLHSNARASLCKRKQHTLIFKTFFRFFFSSVLFARWCQMK